MSDIIKRDFIDIPPFLTKDIKTISINASDECCETCLSTCEEWCKDWCEIGCLGEGPCWETPCREEQCDPLFENCQTCLSGGCQGTCQNCECQSGGQNGGKLSTPYLDTSKTIKTYNSVSITILPVTNAQKYMKMISTKDGDVLNVINNSSLTATFTNLTPNTQYIIIISCSANGYTDSNNSSYTATTLPAPVSPWEWYTPKSSGGNFNLTAGEWLAFCERINQMRVARGLSTHSFATTLNWIGKDKPFYAWIFKQAVSALDGFQGLADELKNIQSGGKIYAWYFSNLKSCLNQAISEIGK